jgi:hypothetical protein
VWIAAGCEAANVPFENAAPKTLDAARWWLPVMSWQHLRAGQFWPGVNSKMIRVMSLVAIVETMPSVQLQDDALRV